MITALIILGILILGFFGSKLPEPKYRCDMCKDSGTIETNIWYDEVVDVECPKCKEEGERAKKINKLKNIIKNERSLS
jgi:hypothetical protein